MKFTESVRISWRAITGHKLRSSLTTLGVVIGIAAVIVFMVLGGGFEQNIVQDFEEDDGEPGMWVNTQMTGNNGFQFIEAPIYTETDVERLESIDGVDYVSPEASLPASQLKIGDARQTGGFQVQATSTDYFSEGDFTEGGVYANGDEVVVSESLVEQVGPGTGVGDELTINFDGGNSDTFVIAGIVSGDAGTSQGPTVYLSLEDHYDTTIETPRGTEERAYSGLIIGAEDASVVGDVKQEAIEYFASDADATQLKQEDHDIKVQTVDDAVDQVTSVIDQLTVFIGGIAGLSLVVGSIGIANIMIVSVTERTREIGIMKAVGARKRDVIQLFIVESSILGAIGALLGVLVGLGVGYLGVTLAGWPMAYPLQWIGIAVAVGFTVGILSGLYPAWRGARVDPIEALRHE
jgi:putative ABC transport system permease protein